MPSKEAFIENPVLRGFNPDPSIVRVGEDYYVATSTFEWFPGVMIYHSRDLGNWKLVSRPLSRASQLDMIGNPDSGGIWAPDISYCDGTFYLIYTDVKSWIGTPYKTAYNYVVTAPSIEGPWSEPTYLNTSGFDPSLFHDEDGRKWLLNMIWDHRRGANQFAGILLQEWDPKTGQLIGEPKNIFKGTDIKLTEAPHIYRKNGYYYLMTAEGGTSWEHAVTLARSKRLEGPYEVHPQNPLLTSLHVPKNPLQKAGHASMVETPDGETYIAHLCGRPIGDRRCILGRETSLQKLVWDEDGWPRLANGRNDPDLKVVAPRGSSGWQWKPQHEKADFAKGQLPDSFQSLRRPIDDSWLSLKERKGYLRLRGQEPTSSRFRQSLVARRLQHFYAEATTAVDFNPKTFQHMAGIVAYYDTRKHYYLRISHDEKVKRCLNIIAADGTDMRELLDEEIELPQQGEIFLRVRIEREVLRFFYSVDGEQWHPVGQDLDSTILSDDYFEMGFTGCFLGMCAQDFIGKGHPADFRFFEYREIE